ncbi:MULTISPECIES: efflux RND transporter periplasmic adaptor subunit [unclassified Marinimicrobium]|jgi:macrolide-specific efflux system membrane fusion protein|uniref:efflux RND transporter periplasmic adaptor subunit n=1 Tax=Marinimicrobium TaxID=359337 RepID=UPI000C4E668A|nr:MULTISPECIES: efflux RND transporter periplasmic adaptor subunit [unclassified Marinimicrobium]MAN52258.1 efflux transporter periplasmic adaptor subunit [Marinimicrobium sp.]
MVVSRQLFKKAVLVAALVLITLAVFQFWPSGSNEEALASVEVRRGNIEALVTATGVLQPRTYVDVGAQVSGQLETLHVQVGDEVKQGDLLAEIDPTVYLARVDGTRAQLRNQQAQLKDRKAQLTLAEIQLQRQKNLFAEDATTREALQSAEASLRSAEAQIEALSAQIEQTQSTLRAEEANLEYAKIYAPMDGTIVTIDARQGQTLNASQTTPILMRIADLDTMSVQAQVSEADIGQLEAGMPVYFTTLGNQGRRWEGQLSRIEPTPLVENNVVLYYALFDVPNPGGRLLPQMTAQVFFVAGAADDALIVPVSALRYGERTQRNTEAASRSGRSATVSVVSPGAEPALREVRVGVTDRVHAEILSGLSEGERVLLSGPESRNRREQGSGIPRMFR